MFINTNTALRLVNICMLILFYSSGEHVFNGIFTFMITHSSYSPFLNHKSPSATHFPCLPIIHCHNMAATVHLKSSTIIPQGIAPFNSLNLPPVATFLSFLLPIIIIGRHRIMFTGHDSKILNITPYRFLRYAKEDYLYLLLIILLDK